MSKTQAYYLEIKLFKALEETCNNVKLKGVVQADEKYFRIILKVLKYTVESLERNEKMYMDAVVLCSDIRK